MTTYNVSVWFSVEAEDQDEAEREVWRVIHDGENCLESLGVQYVEAHDNEPDTP